MAIKQNKNKFRTIRFMFPFLKKYVQMDLNSKATLEILRKPFSKFLKYDFSDKFLQFYCKKQTLRILGTISSNLQFVNETDDSTEILEITVEIQPNPLSI